VLKKELLEHLRAKRTIRRSKHASLKRNGLGQIKNAVSISERPASIEDRAVPGHWEGDLIGGSKNSNVATLVERHSRYVMLVKVANKDTESVVSALIKQSQKLPSELYRSLSWDRGKELADHQRPRGVEYGAKCRESLDGDPRWVSANIQPEREVVEIRTRSVLVSGGQFREADEVCLSRGWDGRRQCIRRAGRAA
jgi:hypothetical protein